MHEHRNPMAIVEREVAGWPGVGTAAGRFDSVSFAVGRRELGHVHRDGVADFPLPRRIRDEVVASGRAVPHRAGVAGYVSAPIRRPEDVANVVALFRLNHERAMGAAGRPGDRRPTGTAGNPRLVGLPAPGPSATPATASRDEPSEEAAG